MRYTGRAALSPPPEVRDPVNHPVLDPVFRKKERGKQRQVGDEHIEMFCAGHPGPDERFLDLVERVRYIGALSRVSIPFDPVVAFMNSSAERGIFRYHRFTVYGWGFVYLGTSLFSFCDGNLNPLRFQT